jgi:hypothetical protein
MSPVWRRGSASINIVGHIIRPCIKVRKTDGYAYKRKVTGSKPVAGIFQFVRFTEAHKGSTLMYKPPPRRTLNIVGYAFDPLGPNY